MGIEFAGAFLLGGIAYFSSFFHTRIYGGVFFGIRGIGYGYYQQRDELRPGILDTGKGVFNFDRWRREGKPATRGFFSYSEVMKYHHQCLCRTSERLAGITPGLPAFNSRTLFFFTM